MQKAHKAKYWINWHVDVRYVYSCGEPTHQQTDRQIETSLWMCWQNFLQISCYYSFRTWSSSHQSLLSLTWLTRMSPILLMMKPPSELPHSSWLSRFLSRRRKRCCVWSSRSSSRAGNSFSTVCSSSCTSFCRPLLYTSDMIRNVRMWCISVCISSEGHTRTWHLVKEWHKHEFV